MNRDRLGRTEAKPSSRPRDWFACSSRSWKRLEPYWRVGRERRRHERSDALLAVGLDDVAAKPLAVVLWCRHNNLSLADPLRKDMPFSFRWLATAAKTRVYTFSGTTYGLRYSRVSSLFASASPMHVMVFSDRKSTRLNSSHL